MSNKKILASFVVLAFFVPCVSFAQTTSPTTYQQQILQLIALLTQEVQSLEAQLQNLQSATAPTATTPSVQSAPSISVQLGTHSDNLSYEPSPNGESFPQRAYYIGFTLTPSQEVYIPEALGTSGTAGMQDYVTGSANIQPAPGTVTCSGTGVQTVSADQSYCDIPANVAGKFVTTMTLGTAADGVFGISAINFKTNLATTTYSTYLPSGLKTN